MLQFAVILLFCLDGEPACREHVQPMPEITNLAACHLAALHMFVELGRAGAGVREADCGVSGGFLSFEEQEKDTWSTGARR